MRWLRRAPVAEPAREVTPLEMYHAKVAPNFGGWFVYAFADPPAPGLVWYAGQTEHLWSRWRDHYYAFGDRFTAAVKYVIPVRDQAQADLIELLLIDFYDPECNTVGRRDELRARMRKANKGFKAGHTYSAEYWAAQRAASLDSGQASN